MRIVITMVDYPQNVSGAVRLAYDEAFFLANNGHEVWIIAPDISRSHPEHVLQDGVHILCYPQLQVGLFDPRRVQVHQKLSARLAHHYIDKPIDMIHGHALLQYDGLLSVVDSDIRRCYTVHSPVRPEILANSRGATALRRIQLGLVAQLTHRVERRCLTNSHCITAVSNYTRRLLRELHGATIHQRVQVIPGWVDVERFRILPDRKSAKSQLGWSTQIPTFFTLRRLVPRMGLDRLILALREVRSAGYNFRVMIGGSGPLRAQLESLIRESNLQENVSLIGFVAEDVLPLMYGAADAFLLPTAELECFGLIALESLACGRPVLATPIGAIPEILNNFEPRWMSQGATVTGIEQLIVDFLAGRLDVQEPSDLRAKVITSYSRDRVIKQLICTIQGYS